MQCSDALGAIPVKTESLEPRLIIYFTHYPTQNRFALLLETLYGQIGLHDLLIDEEI